MEGLSPERSLQLHIGRLSQHKRTYLLTNSTTPSRISDRIQVAAGAYLGTDPQLTADPQTAQSALHLRLSSTYGRAIADAFSTGKGKRRDQICTLLLLGCSAEWLSQLNGVMFSAHLLSRADALVNVEPETLAACPGMLDMETGEPLCSCDALRLCGCWYGLGACDASTSIRLRRNIHLRSVCITATKV